MATAKYEERRKNVMLGNLPDDFLRVGSPNQENASSVQTQISQPQNIPRANMVSQMTICVVQAQLTKNYSLTKMDPYARVRIGHSVFETHSDLRGGKFPNWNKTITSYLPQGIRSIHIEVFDENTITPDERIAHAEFVLPDEALQGKFIDTWVPLSGRQGDGKEGTMNITVYIRQVPYWPPVMPTAAPVMVIPQPAVAPMPYFLPAQPMTVQYPVGQQPVLNPQIAYPPCQPQPYRPTEQDVKLMEEMFPAYDQEVILSVLQTSGGNKDHAITALLSLSDK